MINLGQKSHEIFEILYAMGEHLVEQQAMIFTSYEPILNILTESKIYREHALFFIQLHFHSPDI